MRKSVRHQDGCHVECDIFRELLILRQRQPRETDTEKKEEEKQGLGLASRQLTHSGTGRDRIVEGVGCGVWGAWRWREPVLDLMTSPAAVRQPG